DAIIQLAQTRLPVTNHTRDHSTTSKHWPFDGGGPGVHAHHHIEHVFDHARPGPGFVADGSASNTRKTHGAKHLPRMRNPPHRWIEFRRSRPARPRRRSARSARRPPAPSGR